MGSPRDRANFEFTQVDMFQNIEEVVMRSTFAAAVVAATVVCTGAGTSHAAVIFELDTVYTGDTPEGSGPWLTMTFENFGAGQVLLTMTANLQSALEFFDTIGFNFSGPTGLEASTPDAGEYYTFGTASPNLSGGGVAAFLIGFDLPNNGPPANVERFNNSDTMTILFTADQAINESMFNVANLSGHYAAAHVNGIDGPEGSGKITTGNTTATPEPGTFALLALGGVGIAAFRRKKKVVAA